MVAHPQAATDTRVVEQWNKKFTGFVFKIQANMDPKHQTETVFMSCVG